MLESNSFQNYPLELELTETDFNFLYGDNASKSSLSEEIKNHTSDQERPNFYILDILEKKALINSVKSESKSSCVLRGSECTRPNHRNDGPQFEDPFADISTETLFKAQFPEIKCVEKEEKGSCEKIIVHKMKLELPFNLLSSPSSSTSPSPSFHSPSTPHVRKISTPLTNLHICHASTSTSLKEFHIPKSVK